MIQTTLTLNYAKGEQPIGMVNKLQENRCFHDHNRWECGQNSVKQLFLIVSRSQWPLAHRGFHHFPSPKTTALSDHHTYPPAMEIGHILTMAIFIPQMRREVLL